MMRTKLYIAILTAAVLAFILMYTLSTSLLTGQDTTILARISSQGDMEQAGEHVISNRSAVVSGSVTSGTRLVQNSRRRHLQSVCKQIGLRYNRLDTEHIRDVDVSRIYVDDRHRILYCEVPKVACTNWKRILLILTGKMNTTDPEELPASLVHTTYGQNYLRTLDTYKPRQILLRIRRYYKFMFVRDPLERILSAYRNKFMNSYSRVYQLRYGRKIIRRYRKNPTNQSLEFGNDVRFSEFIQYLLDQRTKQPFDVHWRPFYQLCHPCRLQYDFIGKYETLSEDVNFILEELGIKHLISFPGKPNASVPKTGDVLKTMFANITSEQIHSLWKLYSVDYSLFRYPYPDFTDPMT